MAPLWINCNLRVTQAYQLSCPVHLLFADSESFQIYICVYFQNIIIFSPCLAHTHISWIYNGSNWLTLAKPKGRKYFLIPLWLLWNLIKDLSDNCLDISMHQIDFWLFFLAIFFLLFFVIVGTNFVSNEYEDDGETEDAKDDDGEEDHVALLPVRVAFFAVTFVRSSTIRLPGWKWRFSYSYFSPFLKHL